MKVKHLLLIGVLASCSPSAPPSDPQASARVPELRGPVIDAGSIPQNGTQTVTLQNGAKLVLFNFGGKLYHRAEGTFADTAFEQLLARSTHLSEEERDAFLHAEIAKVLTQLRALGATPENERASVAYFTFYVPYQEELMGQLKRARFEHALLLSPQLVSRAAPPQLTEAFAEPGEEPDPRSSTRDFSGLEALNAPAFVAHANIDIGGEANVDGSSTRIGITDTGITYAHPTFLSADGSKTRIAWMRDFTGEGRLYFNYAAQFTAREGDDDETVVVSAEVLLTPPLPSLPSADDLFLLEDLELPVSAELREKLLTPNSGAKLGFLYEGNYYRDINANGTSDDFLAALLLPGETPDQDKIYLNTSGDWDFRGVKALSDFNRTKQTTAMFAEKVGVDLRLEPLPTLDGSSVVFVRSASLVGYDPGSHGSNVAGIAAGRRTIANDAPDTLARGVAPGASLYMNRVCSEAVNCINSTEAFIDLVENAHVDVVNMSLGSLSSHDDGYGVEQTIMNRLTVLRNVLFVRSAGNEGPGRQTIGDDAAARLVLAVGATASKGIIQRQYQWPGGGGATDSSNDAPYLFYFSARGPNAAGGFKPDLVAPGAELSAVQLNAPAGQRAGLDAYWGTSMSSPAAAGAYALLLDAIKKYNSAHPEAPLSTDVLELRRVLLESARPFDVKSLDVQSGAMSEGQYTWIDQGKGMLDLLAAWQKLRALASSEPPTAVSLNGKPVRLDYRPITSIVKTPFGIVYDGSELTTEGKAAFGQGLYLEYGGTETLKRVYIQRALPENLLTNPKLGELTRQLVTTADRFVLKTVVFGSHEQWLSAGVFDSPTCAGSPTSDLTVTGSGIEFDQAEDGTATIVSPLDSVLNVCIDRQKIASSLQPGDHGALISGYRVVDGQVSPVASFIVPVYLNVPHQTLAGSTAYEIEGSVPSMGLQRHYLTVPEGTSMLWATFEAPPVKVDANGVVVPGEQCASPWLMANQGDNVTPMFPDTAPGIVFNCTSEGAPTDAKRTITFSKSSPRPGTWDLHVFGRYRYAHSKYKLRVDYLRATTSVNAITGGPEALNGSLRWTLLEASRPAEPSAEQSRYELNALQETVSASVQTGDMLTVEGALGALRAYPEEVKSVTITTGGSPGNDLDLYLFACDRSAADLDDESCAVLDTSGSPSDVESVSFSPSADLVYAAVVAGFRVADEGNFRSTEKLSYTAERGTVAFSASSDTAFTVTYGFSAEQVAQSKLLTNPLFTSGPYHATGALTLKDASGATLGGVPVDLHR